MHNAIIQLSEEGLDTVQARKKTVEMVPFSRNTVHKVLKEKKIFGNVLGGAMPHSRLSRFDKLSSEQKEAIRKLVRFDNLHITMLQKL